MPDDLPAADADMQDRREDSDMSASVLQKIFDFFARQVSLAMNSTRRAPGPVPVTPTEAATTATATTASASQAQTLCTPQTQCPPVTSAFVPLSAGGTVYLHHHQRRGLRRCNTLQVRPFFPPPVCLPMPTLSLPTRGCMGLSLTFGHPITPSPTPPPLAGLAWLPRARLQLPPSYPPPCLSTNHRPTTAPLHRRRCSFKMSATRSQRRDRPTIPLSIIIPALPNIRLSGARVALSRSKNIRVPVRQRR